MPPSEVLSIARQIVDALDAAHERGIVHRDLKSANIKISSGFANGMATWSPDGKRLAVAAQNANAPTAIWLADPDAAVPFRKLLELPIGPRVRGITWTKDGALIVGQHDAESDIVLLDHGAAATP